MKKLIIAALLTLAGYTCTYAQTPAKNKADSLLEKKYGIEPAQQPGDTLYHQRKDSIIPQKPGEATKAKKASATTRTKAKKN